jgi:enediyne biosynthesis protein E8
VTTGTSLAGMDRRTLLKGLVAAAAIVAALPAARLLGGTAAAAVVDNPTVSTLEAFADTLIPGEKRNAADRAIAGVVEGPGAVQAGAIALLRLPEAQVESYLPSVAALLDAEAASYSLTHARRPDPTVPPFVALSFPDRTALCGQLLSSGQAVGQLQQAVTLFALLVFVAFHCVGQQHTAEALGSGHLGLAWLQFPGPDPDGLYRYTDFSYRQVLADAHPRTTASGSPA